jgi:MFS family permease
MTTDDATGTDLLAQIRRKRAQVEASMATTLPRKRRLLNVSIVGGALAAVLTTGPAVGGQAFATWMKAAFALTSPAWQVLCAAAAVCSVAATLATQLLKSNNLEERVYRGQSCRAKLEALEVGLSTGQIDLARATGEYMKCLEEAAFLESR